MPLQQIGPSSSILAERSRNRSNNFLHGDGIYSADEASRPSSEIKSQSYGGVMAQSAALEGGGVKRTASLGQPSRYYRHFASLSDNNLESAAARASADEAGPSTAALPRGIGRYGSRWQTRWPDAAEDSEGRVGGGLDADAFDNDATHEESAEDDYTTSRPSRGTEMTLLKLSGMGGVTRSGSLSHKGQAAAVRHEGSRLLTPRSQYRSSLSVSPEDVSGDTTDFEDHASFRRPTLPFAWNEGGNKTHSDLPPLTGVKRISSHNSPHRSSEISSPLSRTSTSSSSAPAHSLSTLTTRHSTSSSSSGSTESSSRRMQAESDEEGAVIDDARVPRRRRSGRATATEDAASEAATSTAAESEATAGRPRATESDVTADGEAAGAKPYTLDDDEVPDPASQVGPSVQRIRSIGRGNNARMASFNEREQSRLAAQQDEQQTTVDDDPSLPEEAIPGEDTIVSIGQEETEASTYQSPPRRGQIDGVSRLQRDPFSKLTWTDAAQAPISPEQERTDFIPPTPRRHTGSYALRSKSALSSGTMGQFSGGGRGRAGMREAVAKLAMSKPTPIPNSSASLREDDLSRVSGSTTQPPSPEQERFISRMSDWLAQRDMTSSPQPVKQPSQDSPVQPPSRRGSTVRIESSPRSPLRMRPTPAVSRLEGLSLQQSDDAAVPSLDATLLPASPRSNTSSEADADGKMRPNLLRAATQGGNINVLRTPTTQEWSRYLIKKGINPAAVAQQVAIPKAHARSRSSTMKSSTSWKGDPESLSASMTLPEAGSASAPSEKGDGEAEAKAAAYSAARSPRLRAQPRLSALSSTSFGRLDDLVLVPEHDQIGDLTTAPTQNAQEEEDHDDDSKSDTSDSSLDERMRALHEAISRPPSRMGSPLLKVALGEIRKEEERQRTLASDDDAEPHHWPQRETAAAVMGYPLAPPGERRTISDFVITSDIGRGAYGLVKKARVKDAQSGHSVGPEFCIKYIIKSRILADCWRRHKTLGPIPVEIHVLDQLRRLTHHLPLDPPPWSVEKLMGIQTKESEGVFEVNATGAFCVGHPALCKMLDFFEDHEFYYLVMPCFGSGQDLFDYVESQPHGLSTVQVRSILGQLADGLKFLHANNIVHRDVKDENVILDGEGHIQLIDFGSAAHILGRSPGSSARRLFDTFSGTLDYAAAEILRGEKYSGKEQDVWALGVVGYVLLCGDCPFWNGEEAMQGLGEGSRALNVLKDRCAPPSPSVPLESDEAHGKPFNSGALSPDDPFIGRAVRRHLQATGQPVTMTPPADQTDCSSPQAQALRRHRDLVGQTDGGGCLADAANLIACCLDLDQTARPTMEQILQHRFLAGARGWTGSTWWIRGDKTEQKED